jgi:transcription elongation factor Elf1
MNRLAFGCAVILLLTAASACNICSDEVLSHTSPPDGVVTATAFVRNCGATTDFSTIVSVHNSSDGYGNEHDFVFVVKGRPDLKAIWNGPNKLIISCANCIRANVFRQITVVADIDIFYEIDAAAAPR